MTNLKSYEGQKKFYEEQIEFYKEMIAYYEENLMNEKDTEIIELMKSEIADCKDTMTLLEKRLLTRYNN